MSNLVTPTSWEPLSKDHARPPGSAGTNGPTADTAETLGTSMSATEVADRRARHAAEHLERQVRRCVAAARQEPLFLQPQDREQIADRVRQADLDRTLERVLKESPSGRRPAAPVMLLEHLEDAPEHDRFRIEQVMPSESNTLIVAQRKAGKTTVCLNLARSLLLGVPFLDAFPVQQTTGTVAFINLELSPAMLRSWASGMGIPGNRLVTVNARGLGNPLETQQRRSQLADQLREYQVEAVIVDPFSVAFPGEDANNSTEVRRWLSDIEEMARGDLGINDLIITAHAGWNADRRARGASALEDWPDSIIRLGLAGNSRTFSATGRDVSVQETSMEFDHRTRVLQLTPTRLGSTPSIDAHIVEVVRNSPGISTSAIGAAIRTRGVNFRKGDENRALRRLVEAGVLRVTTGSKGSKLYHPVG